MADSVDLSKPHVFQEPKGTEITVRDPHGNLTKRTKDPKTGRFLSKRRKYPDGRTMGEMIRQFLNTAPPGPNGKYQKDAIIRVKAMLDNCFDIATCEWKQVCVGVTKDGDPIYGPDAKLAQAAIKAMEFLMSRAYGRESISEEDREALKKSPVQVVILQHPQLQQAQEVQKPTKPSFAGPPIIDAEIVSEQ